MMRSNIALLTLAGLALLGGCTDAARSKAATRVGSSVADIQCFTGGLVSYQGTSTGKVLEDEGGQGWSFVDSATGRLTEISGDCVIRYRSKNERPLFQFPRGPQG